MCHVKNSILNCAREDKSQEWSNGKVIDYDGSYVACETFGLYVEILKTKKSFFLNDVIGQD